MTRRAKATCSILEQNQILEEFIKRRSEAIDGIHILMNPNLNEEERLRLLEVQTPCFLAYLFPNAIIEKGNKE